MKSLRTKLTSRRKAITSADVGRYLKSLSVLHRDPLTGNVAMSEALHEIGSILIAGKAEAAGKVLSEQVDQSAFAFEERQNFEHLSLEKVREIISRPNISKADLVLVGTERFGIAKSRMDRISREEIVNAISSAIQHEESLAIISEEAKRHSRTS